MGLENRIILVGGSVRAVAEAAVRAGWQVDAIDRFGDVDTRCSARWHLAPSDWRQLGEILAGYPEAPIILLGGLENHEEVWQTIQSSHELLGPSTETVIRVRNRKSLQDLVEAFAAESVSHRELCPPLRIPEIVEAFPRPAGQWLWRKDRSCGGGGVFRRPQTSGRESGYWMRCIGGRALGFSFLGGGQEQATQFLGACAMFRPRIGVDHAMWYRGSIGPIDELPALAPVVRFGEWLSRKVDLRGWFGLDVIQDREGAWWLLEVNPRWCASMELLDSNSGSSSSWFNAHVNACRGLANPQAPQATKPKSRAFHAKWTVYARKNMLVPNEWIWGPMASTNPYRFADLPTPGSEVPAGAPFVSILAEGADFGAAARAIQAANRSLRYMCPSVERLSSIVQKCEAPQND